MAYPEKTQLTNSLVSTGPADERLRKAPGFAMPSSPAPTPALLAAVVGVIVAVCGAASQSTPPSMAKVITAKSRKEISR